MLSAVYAECYLCWVSLVLSITCAECYLCWVLLCLVSCWVSLMLSPTNAECHLCWVSLISSTCWVSLCWMSLCWVSWRHRKKFVRWFANASQNVTKVFAQYIKSAFMKNLRWQFFFQKCLQKRHCLPTDIGAKTFSITTFSIMVLFQILSINHNQLYDTQHNIS